ncbi:valine--tRNA ligase, partial [Candidatus Peregrinibacteria bacterium CG_4_10_14_0_2_um_filter_41_8]
MPIPKAYEASEHEDTIYQQWEDAGHFTPTIDPNKKPFVISMPPPNATGQLHLGHATMLALEDIMIRYHRMKGDPTLWLPGTDHAGIATQNKVEQIIANQGLTRHDLGREEFLKKVHEFAENSKDTIRNQIRKMGASCDWTRERYTLDEGLSQAVQTVFTRMFEDQLIYRGDRIVNWCPRCSSTLADDEVDHKEIDATLYYFTYGPFIIATSRPETKLGDTAVAVNPTDKRYKQYVGQTMDINFGDHQITVKVVADKSVDPKFGSGALGVTPAHSHADYELAQKHDIKVVQVINEEGLMTDVAGKYAGQTVQEARTNFVQELKDLGLMVKEEPYKQNLSICYRCSTSIEPLISKQWFVDVNKPVLDWKGGKHSLKAVALDVIRSGDIEIIPDRFNKIYFNWIENLRDWCISRQIWWGHRIPVWYKGEELKVSATAPGPDWKQDPDTFDTWYSSGLWTFSTLGWPEQTEDFKYFHPTSVLETGYDIIFFWVARMILMTTYATGEVPFKQVYLHGLVLDKQGTKMSKSKGNGIDPLDMIAKYGTDAVRLSLVIGATPGNNVRLYEEKIAGYRNFVNKLWNSARFLLMICQECEMIDHETPNNFPVKSIADKWIVSRLHETVKDVTQALEKHLYSEAGVKIYEFLWDEYCDWYLEMSKDKDQNPQLLVAVMQNILKLLHPFIPFVTEKLWEKLGTGKALIIEEWPDYTQIPHDQDAINQISIIQAAIYKIRSTRTELKIDPVRKLNAIIYTGDQYLNTFKDQSHHLQKLARIEDLTIQATGPKVDEAAHQVLSGGIEIYLPLRGVIDFDKELSRTNTEIKETKQYIMATHKKLSNEGFIKNAPPEVVERETDQIAKAKAKLV